MASHEKKTPVFRKTGVFFLSETLLFPVVFEVGGLLVGDMDHRAVLWTLEVGCFHRAFVKTADAIITNNITNLLIINNYF